MSDYFIHRPDGVVSINGHEFSVDVLLTFDPLYTLPTGVKSVKYTIDKKSKTGYHFRHDGTRNIRAEHPCPQLDKYIANVHNLIQIRESLKQEQVEIDQAIYEAITPYGDKRKREYPPIEELIVALWEFMVEGNPNAVNALQKQRLNIKEKYPKS